MTSKDPKEALNSYLTDMLALEHHIRKALDGQLKDLKDYPNVTSELERIHSTVEFHISSLEGVANARGADGGSSAVKKVGSAIAGLGAAAVDLVRNEGMPKNLRDDYTAFNLAFIGYVMLHTTALSLGDREIGSLAQRHFSDYARVVMTLHNIIPPAVVRFLQQEGLPVTEAPLAEISDNIERVWSEQSPNISSTRNTTTI